VLSLSPEASSTLVIVMTQRLGFGSAGGRRREPGGAAGVRLRGRVSGRDARSRAASGERAMAAHWGQGDDALRVGRRRVGRKLGSGKLYAGKGIESVRKWLGLVVGYWVV